MLYETRVDDEQALSAIQEMGFVESLNELCLNMQSSGKSGWSALIHYDQLRSAETLATSLIGP